ncbi:MAG: sensor histidine kinase, partial [Clostridia bacterium]|nr:sensor histidine kinase [Clostridia bacterium]
MKRNKDGFIGFSMIGFLIFFLTVIVSSTMSITVYYLINKYSKGNTLLVGIAVLITILIISIIFTWIDILRRKRMIDSPVKKILDATQKIASGDFSVKLEPNHDYIKYDSYDLIYENINIMTAELSKNEVLKNDFISNVSHEIKTPLAVIQNYAQVLKQNNIPEEQKQEYLNGLVLQTNKLSSLVSNILKLNKLENQKIVPEFSEFDISELLRITTLSFENLFE